MQEFAMASPTSDLGQDLFNLSGDLEIDLWIRPDAYSPPVSDMSSPPYTDIPLTPQSDVPHTPQSQCPIYYHQSLTELEMLNFEDSPMAQPVFSPADLEMELNPADLEITWDYVLNDDTANELPEQADLPQFTLDPALTPPLTPLMPFLSSLSGSGDSSPATPHAPPSPSASCSHRVKGSQTRKSKTPVRRPRRAANSLDKPKLYPCDFPNCVMSCSRPCDLAKHRKRHVKPFKCRICDSWSSSMKDRERHELSLHRKEDHLICEFPNCQHTTARKDNMDNHVLRKHTNRGEILEGTGHL